jgi:hypothetical protein
VIELKLCEIEDTAILGNHPILIAKKLFDVEKEVNRGKHS